MPDLVSLAIANTPFGDEPESEEERMAVFAPKACHEPTRHGEVLAEFGLTAEDFERTAPK